MREEEKIFKVLLVPTIGNLSVKKNKLIINRKLSIKRGTNKAVIRQVMFGLHKEIDEAKFIKEISEVCINNDVRMIYE